MKNKIKEYKKNWDKKWNKKKPRRHIQLNKKNTCV